MSPFAVVEVCAYQMFLFVELIVLAAALRTKNILLTIMIMKLRVLPVWVTLTLKAIARRV